MQMKILLTAAVLFLLGSDACMRNKAVVRLKCPENCYKTAASRITSARVSWDRKDFSVESTRPIRGIYQTLPIYGELVSVDRQFYEGIHHIEYKAVDDGGNVDSCSFRVTVTVIRCAPLQNPHYGMVECDSGNLYGSTCTISCIPGYSIVGHDRITCQQDGHWSDDIPFCRTTTCPDPGTPLHGTRMCTTATHAYGSICSFHCDHGFQLVGNDRIICRADSGATSWSGITPICKEITPPRSEVCPGNLQLTTSTAITEITKPKVVFRTGDGTEAPHICDLFGDKSSYNFTIGSHTITCRAFDPVFGDQAVTVCKFTIKLKPNPCRPLAQPLNGFLLCSLAEGSASSMHETSCRLFCNNGYAFPREDGPRTHIFECDHTGNWQPSDIVPSCVTPRRPSEIRLPSEIYYTSNNCTHGDGLNKVRVSFQSVLQATIRMQHACAINPGDCIVEDVVVECKVDGEEDRIRRYISSSETDTVPVGSPEYRHSSSGGPSQGRQRRASNNNNNKRRRDETGVQPRSSSSSSTGFTLPIQFHFGTRVSEKGRWPIEYHKASTRLYGMFDYFERHVLDGTFTIKSRVTNLQVEEVKDSLTYAPVKAICDIGYKFNDEILLCVPCGAGTYYDVEEYLCEPCSVGMYQDDEAQFHCKRCPPGTASIEPGAMNLTQCLEIDDCIGTPCKNNGRCIDGRSSFTCDCSFGYSGPTCEERVYDCSVHACQSGGSCIPQGRHNYTCSCAPGYYGDYCQTEIINGDWGEWSEWTPCTTSCDGGTTSRNRTCDSPEPSDQGEDCRGAGKEMRVCNDHQCPVCKRLRRPYQGTMKCTKEEDGDLVSCTISCPKGFWFSGPVFHEYACGKNTSYLWPHQSPDNPRCILPACTKMKLTEEAKYEFKTKFPMECVSEEVMAEVKHQVRKRAAEMTKDLACLRDGTCSLDEPQIRGCEKPDNSARKKRSPGDHNKDVDIKVSITYHGKFASLSTPEQRALESTETELQNLRKNLLHEAQTGELVLVIDGESIKADPNSTRTSNHLDCPPGMTQDQDAICCVECSPGTFYDEEESTCILCETGSYQPQPAQSVCLLCPDDMTTYGRGAVHQRECYENGTEPPNIPFDDDFLDTGNDVPLHIIVPVVVGFLLLVCLILIIVYRCKNTRKVEKYNVVHKQEDTEREKKPEEVSLYQQGENA